MQLENKKVWLIMTKCRKYIAKGTPRNRELIEVDNKKDKKRFLTYSSKLKAESAFSTYGFSVYGIKDFPYTNGKQFEWLEAVECEMSLNLI